MKTVFFAFVWFFGSAGVILAGVANVHSLLTPESRAPDYDEPYIESVKISAPNSPIEEESRQFVAKAEVADARVILVQNFLERHNSPLAQKDNFGRVLVNLADKYGIDFRLLPAIAMQESNLCKVVPENSFNCLGLGVHERGTWTFNSYEENFEAAAKILKKNYIDKNLTTPEEIQKKYTPKSNGSWAASVNQWMAEMRYDDRAAGRALKTDADLLEFTAQ